LAPSGIPSPAPRQRPGGVPVTGKLDVAAAAWIGLVGVSADITISSERNEWALALGI